MADTADISSVQPGYLLLIEPLGAPAQTCLTALVEHVSGSTIQADLGASPRLPTSPCEVAVGVYTPDAYFLARADAEAVGDDGRVVRLVLHDLERIERHATRIAKRIRVGVAGFDAGGEFVGAACDTLDLSAGGCRVVTEQPVPAGMEVAVLVPVAGQDPIVVHGAVREEMVRRRGYEYRIAFDDLGERDGKRLEDLLV